MTTASGDAVSNVSGDKRSRALLHRILLAIALVVCGLTPVVAISPSDPATVYYKSCVVAPQEPSVSDEACDAPINQALTGIIIGQLNQKRPAFCYPQKLVDRMHALDRAAREHPGRLSEQASGALSQFVHQARAAVAQYMREHPERLSENTLEVIMAALLHAFPCPG
jgi:hypothetical protein